MERPAYFGFGFGFCLIISFLVGDENHGNDNKGNSNGKNTQTTKYNVPYTNDRYLSGNGNEDGINDM